MYQYTYHKATKQMTINKNDLVRVDHPGDADIWHSFDVSIVNGEETISNSQLYWEEADGNLVSLKAGDGRGLPLKGRVGYGYDCTTPYEFTSAWTQTDGTILTFGNQATGAGYGIECDFGAELILDHEKGYTVRAVDHRRKGNAKKSEKSWITQADDSLFYYEKLYRLDINSDGYVGYIAPKPSPSIVDPSSYEKPVLPVLLDSDFVEIYEGTAQNDLVSWNAEYSGNSLLIQTIEGDDSISSNADIAEIAADGGSGDDEISIAIHQNATAIGGTGADEITLYRGYTDYLSGTIHSGDEDDTISVSSINSLELAAGKGNDSVITRYDDFRLPDSEFSGLIWLEEGDDQYESSDENYLDNEDLDLEIENTQVVVFGGDGEDRLNGLPYYDYQTDNVSFYRGKGVFLRREG